MGDSDRIAGQQEANVFGQMDDRSAGVGEGQDGRRGKLFFHADRQRACDFFQAAKLCSSAKARHGKLRRAAGGDTDSRRGNDNIRLQQKLDYWGKYLKVLIANCSLHAQNSMIGLML